MKKPILIKAGDNRILINGEPPKVDCRIVAEDLYNKMNDALLEKEDDEDEEDYEDSINESANDYGQDSENGIDPHY